jgi:hypothetical protein
VERSTRYVTLLHLPTDHTAQAVRDALTKTMLTLPAHLRRSLTWDQGKEMSQHRRFTIDTDVPVYFCDPHSPWQGGSNENTVSVVPGPAGSGWQGGGWQLGVTLENTGRSRACLSFDLFPGLPTPDLAHSSWLN